MYLFNLLDPKCVRNLNNRKTSLLIFITKFIYTIIGNRCVTSWIILLLFFLKQAGRLQLIKRSVDQVSLIRVSKRDCQKAVPSIIYDQSENFSGSGMQMQGVFITGIKTGCCLFSTSLMKKAKVPWHVNSIRPQATLCQ